MFRTRMVTILLLVSLSIGCKEKHRSLSGDSPVDFKDLENVYSELTLPLKISDTNLLKKTDTLSIGRSVFSGFVPDSVVNLYVKGKNESAKIHPLGKITRKDGVYLLTTFVEKNKSTLGIFYFNDKNQYVAHLNVLHTNDPDSYKHLVSINKEPTFIAGREKTVNNDLKYTRNGYMFDSHTGNFIVVISEGNEAQKKDEIYNPIDTLPAKNKYSGDYVKSKNNFVSLRDGNTASQYQFFIHFEKDDGNCTGELKGELEMLNSKEGVFDEKAGPCVIEFHFESNKVRVKEQGSCGNHRGLRCMFDDTYSKKKEDKKEKKKTDD